MITSEVRTRQITSYVRWLIANLLLTIWVGGLLIYIQFYWDGDESCISQLSTFLLGYSIIMILHLIKKLFMICFWCRGKDPKELEVQLNLFYVISLFLPEIAWYTYGSIVIYSSEMEPCRVHDEHEIKLLWITVILLIVHSYIYFMILVVIAIIFCFAYKLYRDWSMMENRSKRTYSETNKPIQILADVPVVNNLDVFAMHKFKSGVISDRKVMHSPKLPVRSVLKHPSP